MSEGPIEDALKITLQDHRLSRGERRSLAKVVEKVGADEHRLDFARNFAFKLARQAIGESESGNPEDILDWLEGVVKVLQPDEPKTGPVRHEAFFSPDDNCVSRIVRLFESARKSADICVFTITDDRIKDAILSAHRRKVALRIISDNDKSGDLGSDVNDLARRGVPVRVDRSEYHMHHKYAVFDSATLMTGSYNWTRGAARYNEENFVVTNDGGLVAEFRKNFEGLWSELG